MKVAKSLENGKLDEATAEELHAVAGGANNSLFYVNRELAGNLTICGVVFNDKNIAWIGSDGIPRSMDLK